MKTEFVLSEPELQHACEFLSWPQQRLLNSISDQIKSNTKVNDFFKIMNGVYGLIKPIGFDISGDPFAHDKRFQVWLLIRPALTDPDTFIDIETE